MPHNGKIKNKKYILRRAKNGKRREKSIAMGCYVSERREIRALCDSIARKHGYRSMSYAALLRWLAFQEWQ